MRDVARFDWRRLRLERGRGGGLRDGTAGGAAEIGANDRPPGPEPFSEARSIPCASARRRASGEA